MRMLLYVGVVALCALPWVGLAYSQPPTSAGEARQDQKRTAGDNPKGGGGVPGPQDKPAGSLKPENLDSDRRSEKAEGSSQRSESSGDRTDRTTIINLILAFTNVVAAVAVAIFTAKLVRFTKQQAGATEASAAATAKSAAAAENSVAAMQASTSVADQALAHAKQTADASLAEFQHQNALSRSTAQLELRAYVFATGAQVWNITPGFVTPGASDEERVAVARYAQNGPIAMVKIENFGRTPANKFRAEIWMRMADPITPDLPRENDPIELFKPPRRAMMLPGAHVYQTVVRREPLTDAERLAIQNGTAAFYVYGRIWYLDVFNVVVISEFRFVHEATRYGTHRVAIADDGNFETRGQFQQVMSAPWPGEPQGRQQQADQPHQGRPPT